MPLTLLKSDKAIFVTHNLTDAEEMGDRVVALNNGKIWLMPPEMFENRRIMEIAPSRLSALCDRKDWERNTRNWRDCEFACERIFSVFSTQLQWFCLCPHLLKFLSYLFC